MAYVDIPTRSTGVDANSAADVNQLQLNIEAVKDVGLDNVIINGGFPVAQRQVSFAAIANGAYGLDRWIYARSGAGRHTLTQDNTVVPNTSTGFSMKLDVTTADASIAATDLYMVAQYVEGYNYKKLVDQDCILSFDVRSPKSGIHCVAFQNSAGNRTYVVEYTVTSADTWQLIKIPITFDATGTWLFTNGIGVRVWFVLAIGSNNHSTADQWNGDGKYGTSNQVNTLDNTANNFYLTNVKLQRAPYTLFNNRPFEQELALCQRYYEKSYDLGTFPAAAVVLGADYVIMSAVANADHVVRMTSTFKVSKGSIGTISTYDDAGNGGSGGALRCTMIVGNDITGTINYNGHKGFTLSGTNGAASTSRSIRYQWECDAEL